MMLFLLHLCCVANRSRRCVRRNDAYECSGEVTESKVHGSASTPGRGGELPALETRSVVGGGDGCDVKGGRLADGSPDESERGD